MFTRIKTQKGKNGQVYRFLYEEERIYVPGRKRPKCKGRCLGRYDGFTSGGGVADELMEKYPSQNVRAEDRYVPKPEVTQIERFQTEASKLEDAAKAAPSDAAQAQPGEQSPSDAPVSESESGQDHQGD